MATPSSGPETSSTTPEPIPSFEEFVEAQGGDDAAESEATDETESAEEAEEAEGEQKADATADEVPDWAEAFEKSNGDPSVLPPALRTKVEEWNKAYQRNLTRLGMARAEYEKKLEALANGQQPTGKAVEPKADEAPEIDDSTPENFKRSVARLAEWMADRKVAAVREELTKDTKPVADQVQQLQVQADDVRRTTWVRSQEGYSPEVEAKILELGKSSQYWASAYWSDDGLPALYEHAKLLVGTNKKTEQETKRRADLPRRVVPTPNGKGAARSATASEQMKGKSYAQIAEQTFAELYGDGGPLSE